MVFTIYTWKPVFEKYYLELVWEGVLGPLREINALEPLTK